MNKKQLHFIIGALLVQGEVETARKIATSSHDVTIQDMQSIANDIIGLEIDRRYGKGFLVKAKTMEPINKLKKFGFEILGVGSPGTYMNPGYITLYAVKED